MKSQNEPWLTVESFDGKEFRFETVEIGYKFLKEELTSWVWLPSSAAKTSSSKLIEFVNSWQLRRDLIREFNPTQGGVYEAAIYNYLTGPLSLHPLSNIRRRILWISERSKLEAAWTLAWLLYRRGFQDGFTSHTRSVEDHAMLHGMLNAWILDEAGESNQAIVSHLEHAEEQAANVAQLRLQAGSLVDEIKNNSEGLSVKVSNTLHRAAKRLDDLENNVREAQLKMSDDLNDRKKRLDDEWSKITRAYDEQLGLQAPATYWTRKANSHKALAKKFAWASGVAGGAGVVAIFVITYLMMGNAAGDIPKWWQILPTVILAVVFLWLIKTLVRLTLSHTHLEIDASERRVMILSYLAMVKKGDFKEEQRTALFAAIFRPTGNGLIPDDAPPIPIMELLKK